MKLLTILLDFLSVFALLPSSAHAQVKEGSQVEAGALINCKEIWPSCFRPGCEQGGPAPPHDKKRWLNVTRNRMPAGRRRDVEGQEDDGPEIEGQEGDDPPYPTERPDWGELTAKLIFDSTYQWYHPGDGQSVFTIQISNQASMLYESVCRLQCEGAFKYDFQDLMDEPLIDAPMQIFPARQWCRERDLNLAWVFDGLWIRYKDKFLNVAESEDCWIEEGFAAWYGSQWKVARCTLGFHAGNA